MRRILQKEAEQQIYSNSLTAKKTGGTVNSKRTGVTYGDYVGASGGTHLGINGKLAEVVIYDRALSLSEIKQVYTYLSRKYGMTLT